MGTVGGAGGGVTGGVLGVVSAGRPRSLVVGTSGTTPPGAVLRALVPLPVWVELERVGCSPVVALLGWLSDLVLLVLLAAPELSAVRDLLPDEDVDPPKRASTASRCFSAVVPLPVVSDLLLSVWA